MIRRDRKWSSGTGTVPASPAAPALPARGTGVAAGSHRGRGGEEKFGETDRKDLWWLKPMLQALGLLVLIGYANYAAILGSAHYHFIEGGSEGLPEQDAAGELARLWEDAPLTAVLLHLPGQPMALGFAGPRLASLPSGEIKSLTTSALAASRAHPLMPEQVKAVARSLRGDINHTQGGESHMAMTDPGAAALFDGSNHHLMLAGGCAAVVFLLALLLLAHRRRAHRPRLFTLTAPRERFSAPHSGGNNAMVTFLEDIKRR